MVLLSMLVVGAMLVFNLIAYGLAAVFVVGGFLWSVLSLLVLHLNYFHRHTWLSRVLAWAVGPALRASLLGFPLLAVVPCSPEVWPVPAWVMALSGAAEAPWGAPACLHRRYDLRKALLAIRPARRVSCFVVYC